MRGFSRSGAASLAAARLAAAAARLAAAAALVAVAAPGSARAQPVEQPVGDTGGALPGFVRVGAALPLDTGVAVAGLAGYGHIGAVVADEDNHHRAAIDLAASFRPFAWLAFAARFSGRYDRHTGTGGGGSDSGWVGDPHLAARAVVPVGGGLWLGAHAGLWVPGRDAPSLEPSAATTDLVGLASWIAPGGHLVVGAQAGFRDDRSAGSIDRPEQLSPSDRMALGLSESDAVLLGFGASLRGGGTEWLAEWSWDLLVGERAPARRFSPMRVGAGARRPLSPSVGAQLLVEYSLAAAPDPNAMSRLFPVEPRFLALAGLTFQTGRAPAGYRARLAAAPSDAGGPPPRHGGITVTVTSEGGQPLAGAEVVAQPAGHPGRARSARTGPDGRAELSGLERGPVRIKISHPRHRPISRIVEVAAGRSAPVRVSLQPALPPGQLRGQVRSFGGKPLAAELTIAPGGLQARCDERGEFQVDLPPGEYEISIAAAGYRAQRRRIRIEQNGVTILNVDLRR